MSVPLSLNALPNTPSSGGDSASPSMPPPTPLSPTGSGSGFPDDSSRSDTATNTHTNNNNNNNDAPTGNGSVKRKASRRANTAERRATHNAVERQRRETLNGRFLDLAALLPNLATVRRPSKSAIVNSSIALIHSQRRARATAGRELRALEAESDALRREVNEWRARSGAGLPALQPPARTQEFAALVSTEDLVSAQAEEEERRAYALAGQEQEEDYDDAPEYVRGAATAEGVDLAMMGQGHPRGMPGVPVPVPVPMDTEKLAQWNAQLQYALQAQQRHAQERQAQEWAHHQAQAQAQAQAALFTPPGTGHGHPHPHGASPGDVFAGFARQQAPFAYGLPFPGTSTDADEHAGSGTESTHGSPGSSDFGYTTHAAPPPPRRPSLSMAHSTGHVPQAQWAAGGGGGAQFAAMGLLI